jgi:hypothetical protein
LKQEFQRIEGTSDEDTSSSWDVHEQQRESTSEGDQNDYIEQPFGYEDEHSEPSYENQNPAYPCDPGHNNTSNANFETHKDESGDGQSILFADPEIINKFIEKNAPKGQTSEVSYIQL